MKLSFSKHNDITVPKELQELFEFEIEFEFENPMYHFGIPIPILYGITRFYDIFWSSENKKPHKNFFKSCKMNGELIIRWEGILKMAFEDISK